MWLLMFVSVTLAISAMGMITVSPGQEVHSSNCSGTVDYFICNCLASSSIINIHLMSGSHAFNYYPCTLANKSSVLITGNSPDDTVMKCDRFNVMFVSVLNVIISNLRLEGCGGGHYVNVSYLYLGQGSRFVFLFINSTGITFNSVVMQNTLGYGIVAFDAHGLVKLLQVTIKDTMITVVWGMCYKNDKSDFTCSGSGVIFVYHSTTVDNNSIIFDNCLFEHNVNIPPKNGYDDYNTAINIGYYSNPVPLIGAGSVFYPK